MNWNTLLWAFFIQFPANHMLYLYNWTFFKYLRDTWRTFVSNFKKRKFNKNFRSVQKSQASSPPPSHVLWMSHITVHPVKLCWLAAAVMKLRLAACKPVLIQRSLWRRAQRAGTGPYCAAKTRAGALLIWELGGIRLHCYCLFDEGLNLVNPDLHMGFLI